MHAIPLSLYIHFPWCVKKCPYCDFNSHALQNDLPTQTYIDALIADFKLELDSRLRENDKRKIETIFMGGGTPSLFHAKDLEPLFEVILPHCAENVEITLEANPGTIERGQFRDYFQLGINRISLGVQSLNEKHLQKLGRIHNINEVEQSVAEIKSAGFQRFNLDLMHGLPDQSSADALADLEKAISLEPTHLSWYQLTIEPNTYFANHPPVLPNDDHLAEIEESGFAVLAGYGFERYEISAFARNQDYCRHNLNYWTFGDYIGIGAGAHGKLTINNHVIRTTKPKLPKSYLNTAQSQISQVTDENLPFEFMMNAMRLANGFEKKIYTAQTGLALSMIQEEIYLAKSKGLLLETETHLKPSELGLRFLNDLLNQFL